MILAYLGPGLGAGVILVLLGLIALVVITFVAFIWFPIKRRLKQRKP